MNYNPDKHHRRSIRLKGYDYTQAGAYSFTICCHQRRCLLGEIVNGVMHPNLIGTTIAVVWDNLPRHFSFIELDAFVVMPNHIHGIIAIAPLPSISQPESATSNASPTRGDRILPNGTQPGSLGAILQNFKSIATRRINRITRNKATIWQGGYYEEIIRNERAYENIWRYFIENPLRWEDDEENPINFTNTPPYCRAIASYRIKPQDCRGDSIRATIYATHPKYLCPDASPNLTDNLYVHLD